LKPAAETPGPETQIQPAEQPAQPAEPPVATTLGSNAAAGPVGSQVSTTARSPSSLPEWLFQPVTAWIGLVITLTLALFGLWPVTLLVGILMAVATFQDARRRDMSAPLWAIGVFLLGFLVFIVYTYQRRRAVT
jgi:hypothetical protein